jgi:hypothetical protein
MMKVVDWCDRCGWFWVFDGMVHVEIKKHQDNEMIKTEPLLYTETDHYFEQMELFAIDEGILKL